MQSRRTDHRSGLTSRVSELEIRRGSRADHAFAKRLGNASIESSLSPLRPAPRSLAQASYERLLDLAFGQSHVLLIAERAAEPVGFLLAVDTLADEVTSLPQLFIAYMAVEPEFRTQGIARALLTAAEHEARERSLSYISLMVTQENQAALALYAGAGFATERRLLVKALGGSRS